jgi:GNAT superfamily N-acetyltransferase
MLTEQPIAELAGLRRLFPGPQLEMTIASILEGNTLARLWADDGSAMLWDQGNNVFYLNLAGDLHPHDAAHLRDLIAGPVRETAQARGRRYFRARGLNPAVDSALHAAFAPVALHPVRKRFHHFAAPAPDPLPEPEGVRFVPIDGVLLRSRGLAGLDQVRGEIGLMWPSVSRFCERGFGVAALEGGAIVCWCTAEYVSARACGIGIETLEDWQNRGIATAAARRFVRIALSRGVAPHWECDVENLPSVRVAEKTGFTILEENIFHAGLF